MLPAETLSRILLHLTRDDLDAVHLVSRSFAFLVEADVFAKCGPLRTLRTVSVLSETSVKIKKGDRCMIISPSGTTRAAWMKHSFVWDASISANDTTAIRWFIASAAYMCINLLVLSRPFATQQLQDEFFDVVKCRNVRLDFAVQRDLRSALTSKLFLACDQITIGVFSLSYGAGAPVVTSEDLVDFIIKPKRSFIDGKESDPLVVHTPSSGYDRCVYMEAGYIDGEVPQLVAALREKVREATEVYPTFFIRVFDAQMERSELSKLRHLNRATGQHFVVDIGRADSITIKCITVFKMA